MTNLAEQSNQNIAVNANDPATLISVIGRAASDPNTDVDKLERLMDMYEKIHARNAESDFNAALSRLQSVLPEVAENGEIKHGDKVISRYKKWEDVNRVIKPYLAAEGFALSFRVDTADKVKVAAVLSHTGGHSERTSITLPADTGGAKNAVQAVASSVSYGKRYTAESLLNITSPGQDDDAQSAVQPKGPERINQEQADQITARLAETESDRDRFLRALGPKISCRDLTDIQDIPASQFDAAMQLIETNAQRKNPS